MIGDRHQRFAHERKQRVAKDIFSFDSGLPDDFWGTTFGASFKYDEEYQDGETLFLSLGIRSDDPEVDDQDEVRYGCGKEWTTRDKGASAIHPEKGEDGRFHQNTAIATLTASILSGEHGEKAAKAFRERLSDFPRGPYQAGFWDGWKLHFKRQEFKRVDRETKEEITWAWLLVDDFGGLAKVGANGSSAETATQAPAAQQAAPAEKAPAAAPAEKGVTGGGGSDIATIVADLDAIADASATHEAFVTAAGDKYGEQIAANEELKALVFDVSRTDGIWQRAVERYQQSVAAKA